MKEGTEVYVRGNTPASPDKKGWVVDTTAHGWPCVQFDDCHHSIAYPPWRVAEVADGKPWWWSRSKQ